MSAKYNVIQQSLNAVTGEAFINRIDVSIPAGTKYRVLVTGPSVFLNGYCSLEENGHYVDSPYIGVELEKTAQYDVTRLTLYKYDEGVTGNGMINCRITLLSEFGLPYMTFTFNGTDHILQNPYVAFIYLQHYYAYDMPASHYEINGVQMYAQGIKKLKNQTLRFPLLNDPDLVQLIKTNLGNGTIEKLSVNLSSRNANVTLKYDTE